MPFARPEKVHRTIAQSSLSSLRSKNNNITYYDEHLQAMEIPVTNKNEELTLLIRVKVRFCLFFRKEIDY